LVALADEISATQGAMRHEAEEERCAFLAMIIVSDTISLEALNPQIATNP